MAVHGLGSLCLLHVPRMDAITASNFGRSRYAGGVSFLARPWNVGGVRIPVRRLRPLPIQKQEGLFRLVHTLAKKDMRSLWS